MFAQLKIDLAELKEKRTDPPGPRAVSGIWLCPRYGIPHSAQGGHTRVSPRGRPRSGITWTAISRPGRQRTCPRKGVCPTRWPSTKTSERGGPRSMRICRGLSGGSSAGDVGTGRAGASLVALASSGADDGGAGSSAIDAERGGASGGEDPSVGTLAQSAASASAAKPLAASSRSAPATATSLSAERELTSPPARPRRGWSRLARRAPSRLEAGGPSPRPWRPPGWPRSWGAPSSACARSA